MFEHDFKKYPELSNQELESFQFASPHHQIVEDFDAEVVKVVDGDTIKLQCSFRDFTFPLRFLDINAPEMNEGGEEAKEWLKNRLSGQKVRVLINHQNRVGKYGRLLGRVLYGGLDVGEEMLRNGLVKPFERKDEGEIPLIGKFLDVRQWF